MPLAVWAACLLLLCACGSATAPNAAGAHAVTPSQSERGAILQAVRTGFFTTTDTAPNIVLGGIRDVVDGASSWARVAFGAAHDASATTRSALADGHDEALLRGRGATWAWLGYVTSSGCRTIGAQTPAAVAHLLSLAPVCAATATPSAVPAAPATGAASVAALSSGDLATLLSIFVSAKNNGPSGQVLTPTTVTVSGAQPPRAATADDGTEWAVATYVASASAPEPLTETQLEDGGGTAFFANAPTTGWTLRGLAGQPYCAGATAAGVPAAVLESWGEPC